LLCNACQRGHTALLIAVNTVHPEIVHALVKAGADVEVEKGRAERVGTVEWCGVLPLMWWLFASLFPTHSCMGWLKCVTLVAVFVWGLVQDGETLHECCLYCCLHAGCSHFITTLRREDALHFTTQS
jgi:hypothetical protein